MTKAFSTLKGNSYNANRSQTPTLGRNRQQKAHDCAHNLSLGTSCKHETQKQHILAFRAIEFGDYVDHIPVGWRLQVGQECEYCTLQGMQCIGQL